MTQTMHLTRGPTVASQPRGGGTPRHARATRAVPTPLLAALAALCAALVVAGAWWLCLRDDSDPGATLVELDTTSMTREEIVAALDEIVEANMMTISVSPTPTLTSDGLVRVNVVNDASNTFDQVFSLIQENGDGGEVVLYESGVIEPGEVVEWCEAPGAVAGTAYIQIQAVVDGEAHGNPTRVEVTLVEKGDSVETSEDSE